MTFWDFIAPMYDFFEVFNRAYRRMIEKICELIPAEYNVLELASGTGNISIAVSKKASNVLCTDISNNMLKVAKRKAERQSIRNINFENMSIFETILRDNSFDVVIASQILHLLDETKAKAACDEIKRVTKNIAILNLPLIKEANSWGKFLIAIYKIFGFRSKYEFDGVSCKRFLEEIGFLNCEYYIAEGTMPLQLAVWTKNFPFTKT